MLCLLYAGFLLNKKYFFLVVTKGFCPGQTRVLFHWNPYISLIVGHIIQLLVVLQCSRDMGTAHASWPSTITVHRLAIGSLAIKIQTLLDLLATGCYLQPCGPNKILILLKTIRIILQLWVVLQRSMPLHHLSRCRARCWAGAFSAVPVPSPTSAAREWPHFTFVSN